jgi:hypothetical protein
MSDGDAMSKYYVCQGYGPIAHVSKTPVLGKTYWVDDVPASSAPVSFFSGAFGKSVVLSTAHSFIVLALETAASYEPTYKIRTDDGQELVIRLDDFQRAFFIDSEYDGQAYLSGRQYIFSGPPRDITAALDAKLAVAREEAAVANRERIKKIAARAAQARAKAAQDEARYAQAVAEERAQRLADIKARIAFGGVRLGMSRDQVRRSSWQKPENINVTKTVNGESEQWVYEGGNFLYFSDGILTGIQNHPDDAYYSIAN